MKLLLPHSFKRVGAFIAPLGLLLWISLQKGLLNNLFSFFNQTSVDRVFYNQLNIFTLTISFFAFIFGIYFLTFSKEKIEDEMIQKTRVDSFQFAALVQFFLIIIGFILMLVVTEPDKEGMMLFFASIVFMFWLSFICRFNIVLRRKIENEK